MQRPCLYLILAVATTAPCSVFAGGLIQKLPKDGACVTFYMDHRHGGAIQWKNTGSLTVRCVGSAAVDGRKCRWIEFERAHGKSDTGLPPLTRLVKFLVPEKQLSGRGDPLANLVRAWYRYTVEKKVLEPYKVTGPQRYGDNMILLPSAPQGSSVVSYKVTRVNKPRTFPYQKGEFRCKSAVREKYEFVEKFAGTDVTFRSSVTFTLWKHDDIPFGVAGGTIEFRRYDSTGKQLIRKNTFDLSATDFGTNARSALPAKH